jgi:(2R)-sulfolactate sulfo-lyase subunit beta
MTVKAYRRENGRVGVRNHVVILPVDDISNAACEAVANNVKGTLAIPHAYGRCNSARISTCISAP